MLKFISGTRPYSDAERNRDKVDSRKALRLGVVRRNARRSTQRYNTPCTPAVRRNIIRMVGSE